ncbi:MAG TPA: hypothetical protein VMF86_04210 [Stellaceae bacterium]|nr:hypothetical protein [Stellaceae bacterium]
MSGRIEARMTELGFKPPIPAAPAANYVPFGASGNLVFVAGQICHSNGERRQIRLGAAVGVSALPGAVAVAVEVEATLEIG